ncbi:MAG: T9SS type A sorting domain-containing protein [Candidatus Cloacimonetes bacterium]|nr:T9SS type A sorting domain-containing protein [Candidatus Cloacimonadota bacterium]
MTNRNTKINLILIVIAIFMLYSNSLFCQTHNWSRQNETLAQLPSNYDDVDAGTHFNPYLISNLANLRWLSETPSVWGSQNQRFFFKQTADIDAAETESWNQGLGFSAIGKVWAYFYGVYDGDGYHIYNLYGNVHGTDFDVSGMFGWINRSTIKNVHLRDVNITGTLRHGTGGLVSKAQYSFIRWSSVSGNVNNEFSPYGQVGGLVGVAEETDIYHCYSLATVNVENGIGIGGLVGGLLFKSFLRFCFFNGTIRNNFPAGSINYWNAGGIVGHATEAEIRNVYAASNSPFQQNVYGLVGRADTWTTIFDSHWDVEATGQSTGVYVIFGTSIVEVTGFTTSEMKNEASYANSQGWDFVNTWIFDHEINEGYPILRQNISEEPLNYYEKDSGSEHNPFVIENLMNLRWLSEALEIWSGNHFIQTQDIDAYETRQWNGGEGFIPIGTERVIGSIKGFAGNYDGGHHKISNLFIKPRVTPYYDINVGLFGYIAYATIKNLHLENVDMTGSWVVAPLSCPTVDSTITNCSASGLLTYVPAPQVPFVLRSPGVVGGLVGTTRWDTVIEESFSTVTIQGGSAGRIGGIVSFLRRSHIKNSYFNGIINYDGSSTDRIAAGLSATITENSSIQNSYVSSKEEFYDVVAIVGSVQNSTISNTYWDIQTTGSNEAYRFILDSEIDDVVGYTTEEMKMQESYIGWDFEDIWDIQLALNEGYPFLKGFPISEEILPDPVVLLFPENDAVEIDINPVFRWALPIEGGQIEGLRFYIEPVKIVSTEYILSQHAQASERTSAFPTILPPDSTEYTLDIDLEYETRYFWYVVSFNEFGDSVDNQVFNFVTQEFVSDKDENTLPLVTELFSNYPNPFNPATTILFNLGQTGNIGLQVFNVRGQLVKTLIDDVQDAGKHSIIWHGDDNNSKSVASGIYFYRLETEAGNHVQRMLLIK